MQFGKRQAFGLGIAVRAFLGDLVEPQYLPKETKTFSSSANRCQMTLQSALAGIFPPKGFSDWNPLLMWTPVPYQIDDAMLRMYAVSPCPTSDAAWQPITDDNLPDLKALTQKKKVLLDYIAKNTGWNASISNAADLADNLIEIVPFLLTSSFIYQSQYQFFSCSNCTKLPRQNGSLIPPLKDTIKPS